MFGARSVVVACALACAACGRLGFGDGNGSDGGARDGAGSADTGSASDDAHLHVAPGGAIALLVDLTGQYNYNANDFTDGTGSAVETRDNAPSYVAPLFPPFTGSLAVPIGRSVIEISAALDVTAVHDYTPAVPDTTGPDVLVHATFANLGGSASGLWLSSTSAGGGDGLYLITSDWSMTVDSSDTSDGRFNNLYAIAADPTGSYEATGVASFYEVENSHDNLMRRTGTNAATSLTVLPQAVLDIAILGDAVYATVENVDGSIDFDRVGPAPGYQLAQLASSPTAFTIAEGSTASGLFGITEAANLVAVDSNSGAVTQVAWSDDPAWAWIAVSAPRAGHALAGKLIVVESNRALNRDRLLLITPP